MIGFPNLPLSYFLMGLIVFCLILYWYFNQERIDYSLVDLRPFASGKFWRDFEDDLVLVISNFNRWNKLKSQDRDITKVYLFRILENAVNILFKAIVSGNRTYNMQTDISLFDKIKALEGYYPKQSGDFLHRFRKERNAFVHNIGGTTLKNESEKIGYWLYNLKSLFTSKKFYAPGIKSINVPTPVIQVHTKRRHRNNARARNY